MTSRVCARQYGHREKGEQTKKNNARAMTPIQDEFGKLAAADSSEDSDLSSKGPARRSFSSARVFASTVRVVLPEVLEVWRDTPLVRCPDGHVVNVEADARRVEANIQKEHALEALISDVIADIKTSIKEENCASTCTKIFKILDLMCSHNKVILSHKSLCKKKHGGALDADWHLDSSSNVTPQKLTAFVLLKSPRRMYIDALQSHNSDRTKVGKAAFYDSLYNNAVESVTGQLQKGRVTKQVDGCVQLMLPAVWRSTCRLIVEFANFAMNTREAIDAGLTVTNNIMQDRLDRILSIFEHLNAIFF